MGLLNNKTSFKNECATCLMILIGTIALSWFICFLFSVLKHLPIDICWYYGLGFGCSTSAVFMIIFAIGGGLKNSASIFLARWAEFFENLRISFGFAFKCLLQNYKDEGCAFLLYMLLIATQIFLSYIGLSNLIELYL